MKSVKYFNQEEDEAEAVETELSMKWHNKQHRGTSSKILGREPVPLAGMLATEMYR
jgi:hypothetical protein